MASTTYALLVGIDAYVHPVPPLRGCVNDIRRVESMLRNRHRGGEGDEQGFQPLVLLDRDATRAGVIDGFRSHLGQAGPEDVALFYFSGHGSQAPSPPEFWHLEPDRLDETLVCWDSRLPNGREWDLADKELAQLIAEVAEGGAHVVVILDCCHSGSGTRAARESDVRTRRAPTDDRLRPLHTFLVDVEQAAALNPTTRSLQDGGGWFTLPRGRHVVISACNPEEEAKEFFLGGEQRGAFSYYLLDTLQSAAASLSYRDLYKRVNALVRANVSLQSPQIEATESSDLSQPFLGGVLEAGPEYFTLRHDPQRGWIMDGGAVHGIPAPEGDETTWLAIFPFDARLEEMENLNSAIGEARVREGHPTQNGVTVTFFEGQTPNTQTTYKAVVTALPLPPMVVALEGEEAGLVLLRAALEQAGPSGGASLLVRFGEREEATMVVHAGDDRFQIRRKGDGYPLVVETPGFSADAARLVVQRLEHIARWHKILALRNPNSRLAEGDIRVIIELPDGQGGWRAAPEDRELRLEYRWDGSAWQEPSFRIKFVNRSSRRLYFMAFDLTETFGVYPILPGGGEWLGPGEETWANAGEAAHAYIPDELWQQGIIQLSDTLQVIAATDEGDAIQLQQDELPVTVELMRSVRSAPRMSTLNRLLHRVQTRHFGFRPGANEAFADWVNTEVSFSTVRPRAETPIADRGTSIALSDTVTLHGHAALEGRARLTTLPDVSRDVGNLTLPPILRDHPQEAMPFEFSTSRSGGGPGLSVLELTGVVNSEAVTPEQPLALDIRAPLAADETLLPLGFDGEFYLPLGTAERTANGVHVELVRLPPPTGTRSIGGSIKILFQKLVGHHLGITYEYPQLAIARVRAGQRVEYEKDAEAVRQAVAQLKPGDRVLLYIHGIIGNTADIAASAETEALNLPSPVAGLAGRYKLILTYDYENLHTPIEEIARLLKARLIAAGLGPEHDKKLHIVAHSMGGLVSRWFIEREGGNRIVQHLVMLGTPNAGSPWSTIQDWLTTALTIGLNSLSAVAWPLRSISLLAAAIEKIDVTLDQMGPGSDFLNSLAAGADPGIPYTIIAGNTSIIAQALQAGPDASPSIFERLWARIKPRSWLHTASAVAFFGQPNDIAVSVESIQSVPGGHTLVTPRVEVACDHMSYFVTVAGLEALERALPLEEQRGEEEPA